MHRRRPAAADTSATWTSGDPDGVFFGTAVHVTLSGLLASASVEVE